MTKVVLATTNKGKLEELRHLLSAYHLELLSPVDLKIDLAIDETGDTYAQNAALKAERLMHHTGLPALADDSGLEVDALNGAPGLHSARYIPEPGATDAQRRAKLIRALQTLPKPWTAHFRAVVALALPDGTVHIAEGSCDGEIIPEERGSSGFGYDAIFLVQNTGKTMAELELHDKNRLSHRAVAIQTADSFLKQLAKMAEY